MVGAILQYPLLSMDFSSVDDFLRRAVSAKDDKRQKLRDKISDTLEDEGTYAVPVDLHDLIQDYLGRYGDEVFKQVALYALGKWIKLHQGILDEHVKHDSTSEAMATLADMVSIGHAMQMVMSCESFAGNEDYRDNLKKTLSQALLERMEEDGKDLNDFTTDFFDD